MMKFFAIFFLIGVARADLIPTHDDTSVWTSHLPYHISIEHRDGKTNLCNGAIISEYWAVTAARCMHLKSTIAQIRAGTSYVGEYGSIHNISRVIKHENFTMGTSQGDSTNDIALIQVATPFVMDSRRQPIELITSLNQSPAGSLAIRSSFESRMFITQPFILATEDSCRKIWGDLAPKDPSQLCSHGVYGNGYGIPWDTLVGSPMAVDGRLSGIGTQWIIRPYQMQAFSCAIYTDISVFRDWIKKHSNV